MLLDPRRHPRREHLHRLGDAPDVVGRRPAAAADDVDPVVAGILVEQLSHLLRRLVVLAQCVRKAGIRIAADVHRRDRGQLFNVRPHLAGAESTVDTDSQQRCVGDRVPARFHGLT